MILNLVQIGWNIQKSYFWLYVWINITYNIFFASLLWVSPFLIQKKFDTPLKNSSPASQNFLFPPENSKISFSIWIQGGKDTMDRFIPMLFSDFLSKNTSKDNQEIVIVHSCSIFFSILYRNTKIATSNTAKSRHVGEKLISDSDSTAKNTQKMIILVNCVFEK